MTGQEDHTEKEKEAVILSLSTMVNKFSREIQQPSTVCKVRTSGSNRTESIHECGTITVLHPTGSRNEHGILVRYPMRTTTTVSSAGPVGQNGVKFTGSWTKRDLGRGGECRHPPGYGPSLRHLPEISSNVKKRQVTCERDQPIPGLSPSTGV